MRAGERVRAALAGETVDRPPFAFWRHFPGQDESVVSQAQAHLDFYHRYRPDLLKFTPPSGYQIEDWGARFGPSDNAEGTRERLSVPVDRPRDWRRLEALDPHRGALGRQVEALGRVREALPEVPLVFTVFSPLTTFRTATGGGGGSGRSQADAGPTQEVWLEHLREHPAEAERGLAVVTETARRLIAAVLAAGADGVFFATQVAIVGLLTPEELQRWERRTALEALEAASGAWCNVLHIHSQGTQEIFFPLYLDFPVQAINWHDRLAAPTLHEARRLTSASFLGGLEQHRTLRYGSTAQVRSEALDALRQTEGQGHILTPGCVVMIDTPEENLQAVRRAAEG